MTAARSEDATIVPMPRLSDSMEEGTVLSWLIADGALVDLGQEIAEIETDKATMACESPAAGRIWILASAEETVKVGDPIAAIGERRPAGRDRGEPTGPASAPPPPADPAAATGGDPPELRISPVARRLAAERGVDLAALAGSGPGGRILKKDVLAAAAAAPDREPISSRVVGARGSCRRQEPSRSQALVARRMAETRATVPDFATEIEVEMTAALALREQLKQLSDPLPSLNDLLLAAVARTLPLHPRLNASYADGGFVFYEEVNLGFAVAVDDELLVPVLGAAERLTLAAIAAESRRLVERTRSGAVTPPELSGGTFTVSNLGMFGISSFQPLINPPQAAILGAGGISASTAGAAKMKLTLVSDHRIVYGAHAAGFLADLRDLLQAPLPLVAT